MSDDSTDRPTPAPPDDSTDAGGAAAAPCPSATVATATAVVSRALCLAVALSAAAWLVRLFVVQQLPQVHWAVQVFLAAAACCASLFVAVHQWRHWARPQARLARLLPLVRSGEASIEELAAVRPAALAPLMCEVLETLRELRRQRGELAKLEREMSQRVANRTDALERTLGTMRQKAIRDGLTGLYNRRSLDEMLPKVLARCRAESLPLGLLMVDVDDFKLLNDTLGHPAGDALLRSIGQLIRSGIREQDLAFRYGGDEFALVLPGATRREAETMADRLARLVDALTRPLKVPRPPRLSIGTTALERLPDGATPAWLMAEADQTLYANKQARKAKRGATPPARDAA